MNDEEVRILEAKGLVHFEVLSQHSHEEPEESHEKLQ
jgi:hypothetical protein